MALSPVLGGWIAQSESYPAAFLWLGGVAMVLVLLWLWHAKLLKTSCGPDWFADCLLFYFKPSEVGEAQK